MIKRYCKNYVEQSIMSSTSRGMSRYYIKPLSLEGFLKAMGKHKEQQDTGMCFCGSNKRHEDCHADIAVNSIFAYAMRNLQDIDQRIDMFSRQYNIKPVCRKKCNACCSDYFYISEVEYFVLRYGILKSGILASSINEAKIQMQQLRQKCEKEYKRLLSDYDLADMGEDSFYISKAGLCPVNHSKSRLCECYLYRPAICRSYGLVAENGNCAKIQRKIDKKNGTVNQKKIEKHTICEKITTEENSMYIGYIPIWKNAGNLSPAQIVSTPPIKARPLIFWLLIDESISDKYQDAVTLPVSEYTKKYYCD